MLILVVAFAMLYTLVELTVVVTVVILPLYGRCLLLFHPSVLTCFKRNWLTSWVRNDYVFIGQKEQAKQASLSYIHVIIPHKTG